MRPLSNSAECPDVMDPERGSVSSGAVVAFGSVNVIELEVFDMPDILVVGLVHDEWQLIVSAGNRNDECRLVDVFDIILGSIKFVRRVHRL